jgi:predicted methyltransferase
VRALVVVLLAVAACVHTVKVAEPEPPAIDPIAGVISAADRTPEDRAADAARQPEDFLRFAKVKPGDHVADLGAGGGYTTELLVRVVGPTGTVYGQNTQLVLDKFAGAKWAARLARPINAKVISTVTNLDAPLPADASNLDVVTMMFIYHDTVNWGVDRGKMLMAIFAALRPGGYFIVGDHQAASGHGLADTATLHRIEKQAVIDEVTKAGFVLDGESSIYANPADDYARSVFDEGERGHTDRFLLRFKKPYLQPVEP